MKKAIFALHLNVFSLFKTLSLLFLFFMISSCQKEEIFEMPNPSPATTSPGSRFKMSKVPFNEVFHRDEALNGFQKAKKQSRVKSLFQGKGGKNSSFTIDMENVTLIEGKRTHWLTFYISRETKTKYLENLVLRWDRSSQSYIPYLVEYDITQSERHKLKKGQTVPYMENKMEVYKISELYNKSVARDATNPCDDADIEGYYIATETNGDGGVVYVYHPCIKTNTGGGGGTISIPPVIFTIPGSEDPTPEPPSYPDDEGNNNDTGYPAEENTPPNDGNYNPYPFSPSGPDYGGTGGNGGPSPGPGPDYDSFPPVVTSPTIPTDTNSEYDNFLSQLSPDLRDYLSNQGMLSMQIKYFFQENGFSMESKAFVREAIEAEMNDGEVDFDDAYISINTPDDNYVYNGPKAYIPNVLELQNGDKVSVIFGITESDGMSADQEVAVHLIKGLKFALNKANNNLSPSEQIIEIFIMATTNGIHGPDSNHYDGTAMDISRINGQKMALTGLTNQIIQLQKAFDNYQYIRENFGPYFKHKYFIGSDSWDYNFSVGGHSDHIHVSTRKP